MTLLLKTGNETQPSLELDTSTMVHISTHSWVANRTVGNKNLAYPKTCYKLVSRICSRFHGKVPTVLDQLCKAYQISPQTLLISIPREFIKGSE